MTITVRRANPKDAAGYARIMGEADIYAKVPKYVLPEPADRNQLGYAPGGPSGPVIAQNKEDKPGFPHRVAVTPPVCKGTP